MAESFAVLTAIVVGVCATILVITLSVIICWLIVYFKHAKVRARKAASTSTSSKRWKDPTILSTVSIETKPRHAKTYHGQTFKPNAAMDTSGVYIFGVSGAFGNTTGSDFRDQNGSRHGTVSSTSSYASKYRESLT